MNVLAKGVYTRRHNNTVDSRYTDTYSTSRDILSGPVSFASDYQYIDSFENQTNIGGGGGVQKFSVTLKMQLNPLQSIAENMSFYIQKEDSEH